MKTRALPILALAALALAGCASGDDAAPSKSSASPGTNTTSSSDLTPQEQESLAGENIKAAQGDNIILNAHSDTPATVSYSAGSTDKEEQFTGDWSQKVESPGDDVWIMTITPDDPEMEGKPTCQIMVDGKEVSAGSYPDSPVCMQSPEALVQDK